MIASQSEGQADILDGAISSSLMLLSVAHEYLGRHSWCTKNNGAVLLLFLKILKKERKKPKLSANLKEDLDIAFEQCVYCLYGHPNKKIKSRRLQDHNSPPISLTWIRAQNVFEYFKPSAVPEFDSYKASTVSAELEGLLRRVFVLVPEDIGAASRIDTVLKYIDGEINTPPSYETDNPVLKELYYLLADYYFKNKETSKATRFYQYDLCVNPLRLDSWAGTALARMSQLEQKLNAMELKLDTPVHKKAIAALRCFKRAVEINDSIRTLWIEYGSLAYQLHSHASRQLKMQKWFPLEDELLEIVNASKREMLQTSHNCYWKASECEADGNEEEWLHHYMMGKVKEKKGAHPKDYLEHYRQAAIYLHEDEAVYPKRIVFSNSPPHLAIEALEVYYRLHAAILKNLLRYDGVHDYPLYDHYVTEAAASPFAKGREKRQERRESTNEDSCSSNSAYSQSKQKLVYHMTPQDHTYSKKKSTSSSDSDNNYSSVNESSTDSKMEINASRKLCLQKQITEPFVPTIDKSSVASVETDDKTEVKGNVEIIDTTTSETKEESKVYKDSTTDSVVGMEIDIDVKSSASEGKNSEAKDSVTDDTASDGKTSVSDNKMNIDITSDNSNTGNKTSNVETKTSATDTKTSATDTKTSDIDRSASSSDAKDITSEVNFSASTLVVNNKIGASEDKLNESDHDKQDEDQSQNTFVIDLTASDDEPMQESNKTDPVIENKPDDISTKSTTENTAKTVLAAQYDVTDKTGSISDTEAPIVIDSSDVSDVDIDKCILEKSEKNKIQPETKKVQPKKPEGKPQSVLSDDPETVHKQLIEKCMASLHLCLSRFPNHYKSLYRLAHVYATSKYKKNLHYAKDILLGNAHWQSLSHMETPGLFHERKTANFFQGIWKIPVQEIDRAGSFAAHMNRSIYLLLDILKQLQDNRMLYNIHVQLLRVPDTGRKFVRDAERTYLWKLAFRYTVEVMMLRSEQLLKETVEEKRLSFLMDVYKVWHHGIHKLNKFVESTNKVFIKTFRLALQDKVDKNSSNSSILEQATRFCQHRQSQLSARLPQIPPQKPTHLSKSQDSQSDSSLFSPTKSDSQSIFFSPPSKKSLCQGVSMSPVAYSPDTPCASVPGTKISSSPSTPKSSMVSSSVLSSPSTPKSSRLVSNKPSSTTLNVAPPIVEIKKTDRLPVTSATPDIVMSSSTKPPSVKQVSNTTPSTSPKLIQTTSKVVPKEILSAPKGSPKIVQTASKAIPKEILTSPKVSSHITPYKQPSSTVQATITNVHVPKKLVPQITKINSPKQMSPTFPKNPQVVKKANLSNPHVKSTASCTLSKGTPAIAKKVTVALTSQSKPKPPQSASSSDNQVVETLIESHEEDELLILSNPDQLTLDIQSFLAHHNL
ncbi:calcineurin-binding protein cabin-1 [Patella vulgata]|uniref:calcineurin-binding protein cabin-1 n=1 Tax=Patella vulgata TaxID=6465 RepID=UPI00218009D0|nr:calcineurin-binding protein cabin-1 [Patella vulgata]